MLKEYFEGRNAMYLGKKYWCEYNAVKKYLEWCATKTYIDEDGVTWRRCSVCDVYKKLDQYLVHSYNKKWEGRKQAHCKICNQRKVKNKKIYKKNIDEYHDYIYYGRKSWWKNGWKYNTRGKIMRILWYHDNKGKKTTETQRWAIVYKREIIRAAGIIDSSGKINFWNGRYATKKGQK